MNQRPRLKLELSTADKALEMAGALIILAIWIMTIVHYAKLPDTIPVHFDAAGKPDGFGRKSNIFLLPAIATLLFAGLTILNRFPHIFNYPTEITTDNARQQYTNVTRMIRYLKLVLAVIFGVIIVQTIRSGAGQAGGLGVWFLPVTLGVAFIPLSFFVMKAFKPSKR